MHIVDTASPQATPVARTSEGKVDLDAYIGKTAVYAINELSVEVEIIDARTRFGHLDLLVQPITGSGTRWVERKNLSMHQDPAFTISPTASSAYTPFDSVGETNTSLADEVRAIINRATSYK